MLLNILLFVFIAFSLNAKKRLLTPANSSKRKQVRVNELPILAYCWFIEIISSEYQPSPEVGCIEVKCLPERFMIIRVYRFEVNMTTVRQFQDKRSPTKYISGSTEEGQS